jgi:hypothetical protein
MILRARLATWAVLLATLAGCGALPSLGTDDRYWLRPGLARPRTDAASLLHYFDFVRTLPPTEQDDERERLRRAWSDDANDFRRVQFAIVLAAPPSTPDDRLLASGLLAPIADATEGRDADVHLLAIVLLREVELERRLEAMRDMELKLESMRELERRLQSMRELERGRAETAKELERRLETIKEMQRKLDAMKDIERKLLQRGRAPAPEARP